MYTYTKDIYIHICYQQQTYNMPAHTWSLWTNSLSKLLSATCCPHPSVETTTTSDFTTGSDRFDQAQVVKFKFLLNVPVADE
jgi:hypothetical protein